MGKTFDMEDIIDFREKHLHTKSAFCRCRPMIDLKNKMVLHNSLERRKSPRVKCELNVMVKHEKTA